MNSCCRFLCEHEQLMELMAFLTHHKRPQLYIHNDPSAGTLTQTSFLFLSLLGCNRSLINEKFIHLHSNVAVTSVMGQTSALPLGLKKKVHLTSLCLLCLYCSWPEGQMSLAKGPAQVVRRNSATSSRFSLLSSFNYVLQKKSRTVKATVSFMT